MKWIFYLCIYCDIISNQKQMSAKYTPELSQKPGISMKKELYMYDALPYE